MSLILSSKQQSNFLFPPKPLFFINYDVYLVFLGDFRGGKILFPHVTSPFSHALNEVQSYGVWIQAGRHCWFTARLTCLLLMKRKLLPSKSIRLDSLRGRARNEKGFGFGRRKRKDICSLLSYFLHEKEMSGANVFFSFSSTSASQEVFLEIVHSSPCVALGFPGL